MKLKTGLATESAAIMSAYKDALVTVTNKLGEEKARCGNTVAERLAERKRMREQRVVREVQEAVINEVGLGKVGILHYSCNETKGSFLGISSNSILSFFTVTFKFCKH